jgi:hypothetical protein
LELQPNDIDALHNLAVSLGRKARICQDDDERNALYEATYQTYKKANSLNPNCRDILVQKNNNKSSLSFFFY